MLCSSDSKYTRSKRRTSDPEMYGETAGELLIPLERIGSCPIRGFFPIHWESHYTDGNRIGAAMAILKPFRITLIK